MRPISWKASVRWSSTLYKTAWIVWMQEMSTQAEVLATRSRSEWRRVLGEEHEDILSSGTILALVLQDQGKYEAAGKMNRRALEGREKVLRKKHPSTLTSVDNLASVLQYQGKYEAEEMNRRVLEGCEMVLGKEHLGTLTSIWFRASLFGQQKRYEAATSCIEVR
ncbi:hypothetical protein LTR27_012977 [Elasticomyces elasticus]|nr:hypothetical protein LTR27_012977 [Elasticomyces elasticus]